MTRRMEKRSAMRMPLMGATLAVGVAASAADGTSSAIPARRGRPALTASLAILCAMALGCARLPVPTQVIHEDDRILVRIERLGKAANYTHPITFDAQDLAGILKGFSVRERPATGVLRWFGKAAAPEPLFRKEEIQALATYLAQGLRIAKPDERVAFALYEKGLNPNVERVVTSGWIAVRDPFLHCAVNDVRSLQPRPGDRGYYPFYPDLPSAAPAHELYFEPSQFWQQDPVEGTRALQFRDYLRATPRTNGG